MKLTDEHIEQARSPRGGFSAEQVIALGVPWPPPKNWLRDAKEREHPEDRIQAFIERRRP